MRAVASPAAVVLVTGTGTGVGKTVTTATLAATAHRRDLRLAVVKPVQTGLLAGEPGDLTEVERLAGPTETHELVRLAHPLAPDAAARIAGAQLPTVGEHAAYVGSLARRGDLDLILVEGAGGLLVHLDGAGADITDLAVAVIGQGLSARFVMVATAGLGTLNHSALTAEALRRRTLTCAGSVIGSWPQPPAEPDLAMKCNLDDLPAVTGFPLLGRLPEGAGSWSPARFQSEAPGWIDVGPLAW